MTHYAIASSLAIDRLKSLLFLFHYLLVTSDPAKHIFIKNQQVAWSVSGGEWQKGISFYGSYNLKHVQ